MPLRFHPQRLHHLLRHCVPPCLLYTSYLKYYLGAVEILELKKEAEDTLGAQFSLKDFHSYLLRTGPAPFSILHSYLPAWTAMD